MTADRPGVTGAVAAVVLAGGASRRFGSDKLSAALGEHDLLSATLASLPADWPVVLVGPERTVADRSVLFTREDPPGSGPAAALVAGIRATATEAVITGPGDSPYAGRVAVALNDALAATDRVVASADDRVNPVWLGLRGAALARVRDADPADWAGRSAYALMRWLEAEPVPVPADWLVDVDVPADLDRLRRD